MIILQKKQRTYAVLSINSIKMIGICQVAECKFSKGGLQAQSGLRLSNCNGAGPLGGVCKVQWLPDHNKPPSLLTKSFGIPAYLFKVQIWNERWNSFTAQSVTINVDNINRLLHCKFPNSKKRRSVPHRCENRTHNLCVQGYPNY